MAVIVESLVVSTGSNASRPHPATAISRISTRRNRHSISAPGYAPPVMSQMDLFGPRPTPAPAKAPSGDNTEYLKLVDELSEHDRRYYVDAAPTISDVEYDKLLVKLRDIEKAH